MYLKIKSLFNIDYYIRKIFDAELSDVFTDDFDVPTI